MQEWNFLKCVKKIVSELIDCLCINASFQPFVIAMRVYKSGSCSMGVANVKSSGKSAFAWPYINLYDCLMVASATPAMSPISLCVFLTSDAFKKKNIWKVFDKSGSSYLWCHIDCSSSHWNGWPTSYNVHFNSFPCDVCCCALHNVR